MTDKQKQKVEFNHLIILAKEKQKTADFITELLDFSKAISSHGATPDFFLCISFDNDVMVFVTEVKEHPIGHYAFKVSPLHFDNIVERLKTNQQEFWADTRMQRPCEWYEQDGKRGFYVIDPSGHGLEVLTKIDSNEFDTTIS